MKRYLVAIGIAALLAGCSSKLEKEINAQLELDKPAYAKVLDELEVDPGQKMTALIATYEKNIEARNEAIAKIKASTDDSSDEDLKKAINLLRLENDSIQTMIDAYVAQGRCIVLVNKAVAGEDIGGNARAIISEVDTFQTKLDGELAEIDEMIKLEKEFRDGESVFESRRQKYEEHLKKISTGLQDLKKKSKDLTRY